MSLSALLDGHSQLFIQQKKELAEILIDWETKNQYAIFDAQQTQLGLILERAGGAGDFIRRAFLRSHRPFDVRVTDAQGAHRLSLTRPFFFLFSTLKIEDEHGRVLGNVRRRFGVIYKRYDLLDATERVFASIKSPRWRLWTFPVAGADGHREATISKKWKGALREIFTDADTFSVDFGHFGWTTDERAVLLGAAISIDFDFFENNQGSGGVLGVFDS